MQLVVRPGLALLIGVFLAAVALVLIFSPPVAVFATALSVCLLVILVAAWSCAIRERSFGILGFSDLALQKPRKARLSACERAAVQVAVATIAGIFVALVWHLVGSA